MAADAVAAGPDVYTVLLDNDRVRVLEVRAAPGTRTDMHSHPAMVAIGINTSQFRFTFPDGQTVEAEMAPGQAMYLDPVEHSTEITGVGSHK